MTDSNDFSITEEGIIKEEKRKTSDNEFIV